MKITDQGIAVIELTDEEYPYSLSQIQDPPERLYCKGNVDLLSKRCVAMVGSRKTTNYGRSTARELASKIAARGVVVVSGMAAGIDTCAHEGAISAGGETIAVLGCGPDVCYPRINEGLKEKIEETGLIVSEYAPGIQPAKYNFPRRNRIISGISEAIIVVPAGMKSGAAITAELAAEQGRSVYAVPGNIDSQYNLGSNKLLQEGAEIILTPGDLLDKLGLNVISEKEADRLLGEDERIVYELLSSEGEQTVDQLCIKTARSPSDMMKILAVMELKGITFSDMGKIFVAKYRKTTYNH